MAVQLKKRLVSVEEYHLMAEVGIIKEEDRLELLRGEMVYMSPIGSRHALCVNKLNAILVPLLTDEAFVSVQNPIHVSTHSEPEPDFAIIQGPMDRFIEAHPKAKDVLLIIEVADSSLEKDQEIKLPLYAEANIPIMWIVNIAAKEVAVYSVPDESNYLERKIFRKGSQLPIPFIDSMIPVDQLFI